MPIEVTRNRRPPMLRDAVGRGGSGVGPTGRGPIGQFSARQMRCMWRSPIMYSDRSYSITGTTKDSTGAALGACVVELFYTATDLPICKVLSDATTGAFTFLIGPNSTYYIVAYKAGSPDVAGTTVNTLTAA